jgi:hypothetical protein
MDEEEDLEAAGFKIDGEDEDMDLDIPEGMTDFGLDEEDPDKDH